MVDSTSKVGAFMVFWKCLIGSMKLLVDVTMASYDAYLLVS